MSGSKSMDVDAINSQPPTVRAEGLLRLAKGLELSNNGVDNGMRERLIEALASVIEEGVGERRDRIEIGEELGRLGDPRISDPAQVGYWVEIQAEEPGVTLSIGRFPVTNAEFRKFVDAGGYEDESLWSAQGWTWLQQCSDPWPVRAADASSSQYVVANQPVVGVTWYEAEAYARANGARLPRFDERLWVVRGSERRPYPWGSPFGDGNANTKEEVVGRPCAVGLYVKDCTPDGVRDLAGNVAEWAEDGVAGQHWIHPGAWDQPSMAAWAKARFLEAPDSRWAGLGFRLAKD